MKESCLYGLKHRKMNGEHRNRHKRKQESRLNREQTLRRKVVCSISNIQVLYKYKYLK